VLFLGCRKTAGLEEEINIGVGTRVMLRRNLDVSIGLVNGALGTVTGLKGVTNLITKVTVKFDDISAPVDIERIEADYEYSKNIYVTRSMFPLVPSFALTCHKSQGLTLDRVLIDLGPSIFDAGMAYVALSRSKHLNAITIIDLDATKILSRRLIFATRLLYVHGVVV